MATTKGKFRPTERIYNSQFMRYLKGEAPVLKRNTMPYLRNITKLDSDDVRTHRLFGRLALQQLAREIT